MKRNLLILLIIFVLVNIGLFLFLKKDSFLGNVPFGDSKTVTLPVDPNLPHVSSVVIVYNFEGTVAEIKPGEGSMIIRFDTTEEEVPEFLVDLNTDVYRFEDDTQLTVGDIKVGDEVLISANYLVKEDRFEIISVNIK